MKRLLNLLVLVLAQQFAKRIRAYRRSTQESIGEVTGLLGEIFGATLAVKVADAERRVVAHLEGLNDIRRRATLRDLLLTKILDSLGASSANLGTGTGHGRSGHQGVFETAKETVGTADIVRDHGLSTWFPFKPSRYTEFEIGYSRSVVYALDSVFFGVDSNLAPLVGRRD